MIKEIKDIEKFEELIVEGITLVYFYTNKCGICKKLDPILKKLSKKRNETFYKLNADKYSTLANNMSIRAMPTVVIFKWGVEVELIEGVKTEKNYEEILNYYINE